MFCCAAVELLIWPTTNFLPVEKAHSRKQWKRRLQVSLLSLICLDARRCFRHLFLLTRYSSCEREKIRPKDMLNEKWDLNKIIIRKKRYVKRDVPKISSDQFECAGPNDSWRLEARARSALKPWAKNSYGVAFYQWTEWRYACIFTIISLFCLVNLVHRP